MLKYTSAEIVFREFPDETALAFNISGCPIHCKGCHSKWLWEDIGTPLTIENIKKELLPNIDGVTCIGFMGGDSDPKYINALATCLKKEYPNIKIGWYSGRNHYNIVDLVEFDYIKLGPYEEEHGGLDNPDTNQRMYKIEHNPDKVIDITDKFWNK